MMPMSFNGSNKLNESSQYLNIQLILVICLAYIMNLIDVFNMHSKSENEKYFADNLIFFFSSAMNGIFYISKAKYKKIIETQIDQELIQTLWDIVILYEVFASKTVIQKDDDSNISTFEVESENESGMKEVLIDQN